jgi:hypothetical protein
MMLNDESIVQISAYPGWIVGVSGNQIDGYFCWVISSDCAILNDGRLYETSNAAMVAGRTFVESLL